MAEFVVLTNVPNRVLAQPLLDFLQYHEIEAHVQSDDCGGVDPALNFIHGTRVLVRRTDLERAQTFLQDFHRQAEFLFPDEDDEDESSAP